MTASFSALGAFEIASPGTRIFPGFRNREKILKNPSDFSHLKFSPAELWIFEEIF